MYLSLCILGIAFAILFNSAWLLAGTLPFCIYLHSIVIPAEESYLRQAFGDEYIKYTEKTRRWF